MSTVLAYYLSACSPSPLSGEPDHSAARRQGPGYSDWTELLRIDETFDRNLPELVAAILADHLGRPPVAAEISAVHDCGWARYTPAELDSVLGPTRQLALEVTA